MKNISTARNVTVIKSALRTAFILHGRITCQLSKFTYVSFYFVNCNVTSKENFPFDIPQPKTKIGVQRQRDGTFHVFVNGEDQGVAAMDIPQVI